MKGEEAIHTHTHKETFEILKEKCYYNIFFFFLLSPTKSEEEWGEAINEDESNLAHGLLEIKKRPIKT